MIVHYHDNGQIWWMHSDPEPDALAGLLAKSQALHIPNVPLPPVVVRDANGKPVIEGGKVRRESPGYTQQEVTHEYHMVAVAEDGTKCVVERPRLPAGDVTIRADGKNSYKLETLPGSVVKIDGEQYTLDDGKLEFTTADAGTYLFEAGFPFVDWRVWVAAR